MSGPAVRPRQNGVPAENDGINGLPVKGQSHRRSCIMDHAGAPAGWIGHECIRHACAVVHTLNVIVQCWSALIGT